VKVLGIGVVFLIVACSVVGIRLLLLARRTRQIPELALGSSFLLLGAIGYPLSIVARTVAASSESGAGLLLACALLAQNLASMAAYVATWRIFRPTQRWASAVVCVAGAAFVASLVGDTLVAGSWRFRDGGFWYYLGYSGRAAAFFWAAAESVRYHSLLKRRLHIGLADPVVTDRFRLWALTTLSISVAFLVFLAGRLLALNVSESPAVLAGTSLCGIVGGVSMWLAFFPPPAYTQWVRARSDLGGD
jgi:hypothetical protein